MKVSAYFIFEYKGTIEGLFEREYIVENIFRKIKLSEVETMEFLKKVIVTSDLDLFKKTNPITLEFDSLYDISPPKINTQDTSQIIEFKLKSKQIDLIDLKGKNITFSNHLNEIQNIEIPENYYLYKL